MGKQDAVSKPKLFCYFSSFSLLKSLHQPKTFSCSDCSKKFRLGWKLKEHQRNVHAPKREPVHIV
jgi:hypothetical protein